MSTVPEDRAVLDGVRALMKQRKMTLRRLATKIGIPYRTLQNYLNGETRFPASVFLAVCEALGLGKHYVLSGSLSLFHYELADAVIKVFGESIFRLNIDQGSRKVYISETPSTEASHKAIVGHMLAAELSKAYEDCLKDTLTNSMAGPASPPGEQVRQKVRQ